MSLATDWLNDKVLIPELLRAAPQARAVLDRYGLRGCGGRLGPHESLAFFARAHDVPVERLLGELRAALDQPPSPTPEGDEDGPSPADAIYRPFFRLGIVTVLTLGAVWGAYLLLRIGWQGTFAAAGLHEVNAHGHAQIFGWVGLFVMGFAYQAFPRFKHTSLAHPRLAFATLWLMAAGLVGRSVLEPLAASAPYLATAAIGFSALEVIAIGLFAWVITETWRASGKPLAFNDWYIVNALAWFVIQAFYETVYLAATLAAPDRAALLQLVATWQAPLRDIQIHGFALLMILGVSQWLFPHVYGLPAPSRRVSLTALAMLNVAVPGEVIGLVLMRQAGHAWAGVWYGSVVLLAVAVGWLVWDWRVFATVREPDRSLKFLRAAYGWLLVSLAMLLLLPAYQFGLLRLLAADGAAAQLGFSHAFYGATRHAITVGFVSLMIVGVAARVVPTLNGVAAGSLSSLWVPFLLINAGCVTRVVAQTATDFTPSAFPVAGVSGLLEVLGLAIWGAHLWRIMSGRIPSGQGSPATAPLLLAPGQAVRREHVVGDVLDCYPELRPTFVSFGFRPLNNPVLRRTAARVVTVEGACRLLNVDVEVLLAALNAARRQPGGRRPLPLVSEGGIAYPGPSGSFTG